jgi:hypothetical protein
MESPNLGGSVLTKSPTKPSLISLSLIEPGFIEAQFRLSVQQRNGPFVGTRQLRRRTLMRTSGCRGQLSVTEQGRKHEFGEEAARTEQELRNATGV